MAAQPVFTVTYWGVTGTLSAPLRPAEVTDKVIAAVAQLIEQGSLAGLTPGPNLRADVRRVVSSALPFHLRSAYGGNTTCVEVQTPDALLILDSGSGFRELGTVLAARWQAEGAKATRRAHILITHPHMDHTFGTPYFVPYYDPRNHFTLWGTQRVIDSINAVLDPHSQLSKIYFPPTFEELKAIREFRPVEEGAEFHVGGTRVTTFALRHPGGCLAYRLENAGKVFVFATDHEQQEVPDRALADFARSADLLYTEGQYTQDEYEGKVGPAGDPPLSRRGWGHSPIEACVRTAVCAGVRELHVGHREPRHGDEDLARVDALIHQLVQDELRRAGKPADGCRALIPYEGLTVEV
jgi:phosphoribosyl 1,2-cyclic phosphodiesterase